MSTAFFTLGGVILGGLITIAVGLLRQRHEERIADKAFEREQTARLNEEVMQALSDQIEVGTKLATLVSRAKMLFYDASTAEERERALEDALAFVGIGRDAPSPWSKVKPAEFYEDGGLRSLVQEHAALVKKANEYGVVGDRHPEMIPDTEFEFFYKVDNLKTKIEIRARQIRRAGMPL